MNVLILTKNQATRLHFYPPVSHTAWFPDSSLLEDLSWENQRFSTWCCPGISTEATRTSGGEGWPIWSFPPMSLPHVSTNEA